MLSIKNGLVSETVMNFFKKNDAAEQALKQSILAVVTIDENNNITFYNII